MQSNQAASFKAGIFVLISGALVIAAIMVLGQRSQLFTRRYKLRTQFTNARGLIPGSDVRVAGVTAGTVRTVEIARKGGDGPMVRVTLEVAESYFPFLREDSMASIRTLSPLGDKYVEITLGSSDAAELRPGGAVIPEEPVDFYEIAEQAREALNRANQIAEDVGDTLTKFNESMVMKDAAASAASIRHLLEGAEKGPSLAHTILFDPDAPRIIEDLRATARALRQTTENVQAGKGDLGELITGENLKTALADIAAAAEAARAVLEEVQDGEGLAHTLIYDPKPSETMADLAQSAKRLNSILAKVEEGDGTLGLLITDPSLWESMARVLGSAEESRALKYIIRRSAEDAE